MAVIEKMEAEGLTDARGFQAYGVSADVRGKNDGQLDTAVLYSETPCTAAGVFTRNRFAAAPVQLCREVLDSGEAFHGIVVNSGNANACTGRRGEADARQMQETAARAWGVEPGRVFVASTGRIGEWLPMERLVPGIAECIRLMDTTADCGKSVAAAILTSDTRPKLSSRRVVLDSGETFTVAGMAKGAGMINPSMATMLAFVATDAAVSKDALQVALLQATAAFNAITVDDDCSTNDTVLALANGVSGAQIDGNPEAEAAFQDALATVCADLAEAIVADGERISKVVEVLVEGAKDGATAEQVAREVGGSLLVKTSWYGGDPNWGRLLSAAGASGAEFDPTRVTLSYRFGEAHHVTVFAEGEPVADTKEEARRIVAQGRFTVHFSLGEGTGAFRLLSTDLTEGYVRFNRSE